LKHNCSDNAREEKNAVDFFQNLVATLFGQQNMRHSVEPRAHSRGQTSLSLRFYPENWFHPASHCTCPYPVCTRENHDWITRREKQQKEKKYQRIVDKHF